MLATTVIWNPFYTVTQHMKKHATVLLLILSDKVINLKICGSVHDMKELFHI